MPPEDDKNLADVWKEVGDTAIKCGVSIEEMVEVMRRLSSSRVSAAQAGASMRQALQKINEQEQEENHQRAIEGTKTEIVTEGNEFWQCDECGYLNKSGGDPCALCGVGCPPSIERPVVRNKVRVIRFLKKLGLKDVC